MKERKDGWMKERKDGWMNERKEGWMDGRKEVRKNGCRMDAHKRSIDTLTHRKMQYRAHKAKHCQNASTLSVMGCYLYYLPFHRKIS